MTPTETPECDVLKHIRILKNALVDEKSPYWIRKFSEALHAQRVNLAGLLSRKETQNGRGSVSGFFVVRRPDGTLALEFHGRPLPVNESYLAQCAIWARLRFEPPAGTSGPFTAGCAVSDAFAQDVIEEALAATGHDIVRSEDLKRSAESRKQSLLRWFEIATSPASERSCAVA